jgi:hypothetical protein
MLKQIADWVHEHRAPDVAPPVLILFWDKVYGKAGERGPAAATWQDHIHDLMAAGWKVHGPWPPARR